jgi:hypothetical protein
MEAGGTSTGVVKIMVIFWISYFIPQNMIGSMIDRIAPIWFIIIAEATFQS